MSERADRDLGYTVERYFRLAQQGLLEETDHVELLEGLVVASPPREPLHAAVAMCVDRSVRAAVGDRASIRIQMPLIGGSRSAPQPDLAVVEGTPASYRDRHPTTALLVVEIADTSLPQDRLTKSRIYARANVTEYWIVNLRDRRVEVHLHPDRRSATYRAVIVAERGETVELAGLPGTRVAISDLFPGY
ncbi:MAG TPA: Uma2 family endonuclease [Candidatus Limnocylindrales bacterium]|nr:Uma2 family endonuclease [Candidatus Limnocylindrales bacterium]